MNTQRQSRGLIVALLTSCGDLMSAVGTSIGVFSLSNNERPSTARDLELQFCEHNLYNLKYEFSKERMSRNISLREISSWT